MRRSVNNPKIVIIGGGTGSFTLLSALKTRTESLTAIVNMADDGGSTGVLRDELGVLPPGDVRQCLVALSESSQALRELFNYRFPAYTTFAGHSFGNLFISAVEMMGSDFNEAVLLAGEVLHITGRVLPVTLENCHLILETTDGTIKGEYKIANLDFDGKKDAPKLRLEPEAQVNPLAKGAILDADLVVIAPGNLYGSLAPALLVKGIARALSSTKAPVVYVCNLVNKPIQTRGFSVHDYIRELERFVGSGVIDFVLYNKNLPSTKILKAYAQDGEFPVSMGNNISSAQKPKIIEGNFLAAHHASKDIHDTLILRSLIRHDADAIAKQLMKLAKP